MVPLDERLNLLSDTLLQVSHQYLVRHTIKRKIDDTLSRDSDGIGWMRWGNQLEYAMSTIKTRVLDLVL